MSSAFRIKDLRVYTIAQRAEAGTYFKPGEARHWLVDSLISNPMSGYARYREKRSSWGIGVLGAIVVEIEAEDGTIGVATGSGGAPAAWIIHHHFRRFLIGEDARKTNMLSDQLYRSSLPYGRKGLPVMAISAVDLALWDLIGKIRVEPVYNLIGGMARDEITFYCTTPEPAAIKALGFWGAKVPLPHSHFEGEEGLRANVEFLRRHRESVGPDYPLMVDCYMSLSVDYAIRLAEAAKFLNIHWWEEVLSPEDVEGLRAIKAAHPTIKWTTGEHEYSRYGFRRLIEERTLDIIQPDVMWVGGLTELLKIAAHASAYDIPVVPHGSGPYSYHFIASQTGPAFCEYVAASPDGRTIMPVFGSLFEGEQMPQNGKLKLSDAPGFGMTLADRSVLEIVR
ncbi:MAG: L-rhamnonate dehydratase [Hyphomicrobiales bacterium]|nr:L-rhamnonate dehydratase [Hyphomicrobiales bacterium]